MKTDRLTNSWLLDFAADFFAIVAAYYSTLLIRFHSRWGAELFAYLRQGLDIALPCAVPEAYEDFYVGSALRITVQMTALLCALYALRDLYPGRRFIRPRAAGWNIVVANVMALGIFYAYFYMSRNVFHPRSFFATVAFFNIFYTAGLRALLARFLRHLRTARGFDLCPALLIGRNSDADFIAQLVEGTNPHGIQIVERLDFDPAAPFPEMTARLERTFREKNISMIIAADRRITVPQVMELLDLAGRLDLQAKILSDQMDILITQARLTMDTIHGVPLAHFEAPSAIRRYKLLRNALSWLGALFATLLLAPLMGIIALLIKLTSPGPVLFVQERIGVDRKPFRMFKFRTMRDRADELQAQVEEFNESGKALFKMKADPRVTAMGRFLRRFSLDELPQLINVLRGEMVLVGPRPLPRRDYENYYEDWHYSRHAGMPGLTCLWQISGRSDLDFHNMCILDIYYLRNKSWVLDLKIILRTFWAILFAKGAY